MLAAAHSELPLQVQRPITTPAGEAIVTLLTPAGALLTGDEIELEVECGPGARVTLVQPAATKLHACPSAPIRYRLRARVATGAVLRYLPRELIPHAGSEYDQRLALDLEVGAEVVLAEVIGPGRHFDRFQYRQLTFRLEARLDEHLLAVDALRLAPGTVAGLGGYSHIGSLFHFRAGLTQADADRLHCRLQAAGVLGSASLLPAYGLSARALGHGADALRAALVPAAP